jgi:hypothetical protein
MPAEMARKRGIGMNNEKEFYFGFKTVEHGMVWPFIKVKSKLRQLFCRHAYREGLYSKTKGLNFLNLNGTTYTTACLKCGKIKGSRFVRDPWCE